MTQIYTKKLIAPQKDNTRKKENMTVGLSQTTGLTQTQTWQKTPTVIAADGGNRHYRLAGEVAGKLKRFVNTSQVFVLPEFVTTRSAHYVYVSGELNNLEGKRWLVGKDAMTQGTLNGVLPSEPTDEGTNKADLALQLFVATAWPMLPERGTVHLFTTIDNAAKHSDELKAKMNGWHIVERVKGKKTERKEIDLKVSVLEEPSGIIRLHRLTRARSIVLDIGNGTPTITVFEGFTRVGGQEARNRGFMTVAAAVSLLPEISKAADLDRLQRVYTAIENGSYLYQSADESEGEIDIRALVESNVEQWFDPLYALMINSVKGHTSNATFLATGGATKIESVANRLEDKGFEIVKNPLWDNVLGVWQIAQSATKPKA